VIVVPLIAEYNAEINALLIIAFPAHHVAKNANAIKNLV
jgi:hypothetical protein